MGSASRGFPGMSAWDREIVRSHTLKAAGLALSLVTRFIDWVASGDRCAAYPGS